MTTSSAGAINGVHCGVMDDPEVPGKRRSPEPEIQVAAAAVAAAISPPLGIAVAAGSALRSRRVREALRKGTVTTLAGAMQLGDQLSAAATARAAAMKADPPPAGTGEHEQASAGT